MEAFPLVSATGMLGSGFRADSLDKAIALGARMIGCDAGSTDPGPGPLATGTCMFSAAAVKRDTEIMMTRAIKAGIPLIIGSAGTSGSDAGLAWMLGIVRDIAHEHDLHCKLATIHSELSRDRVRRHLREGRTWALTPSAPAERGGYRRGQPNRRHDGCRANPGSTEGRGADSGHRPQQ